MMNHPVAAIAVGATWLFFLIRWTLPSARRGLPHMVLVSFILTTFLTLVILTIAGVWQPTSHIWLKVVGWAIQVLGIVLLAQSFRYLSSRGKPLDEHQEPTVIVDTGVYGLIRHPMYGGIGTWAVGIAIGRPTTGSILIAAACVAFALLAAAKEDEHNLRRFGKPYAEYMRRVPLMNLFRRPPRR
jgi:protein-S-isoprenylcysteine O-methyltransferase Ste14